MILEIDLLTKITVLYSDTVINSKLRNQKQVQKESRAEFENSNKSKEKNKISREPTLDVRLGMTNNKYEDTS